MLKIKDLKKGETIYESQYGQDIRMTLIEEPVIDGDKWSVNVRCEMVQ